MTGSLSRLEIKITETCGRGVFATCAFEPRDIIELCPTIIKPAKTWGKATQDYVWEYGSQMLLALGFGSLYNHSDFNNAEAIISDSGNVLKIIAIRHIDPGEEIRVSYGQEYWSRRKSAIKI
jgi:uncharacterized protein